VKYAWIAAESACFAVARLCELLAVSRSGFYAWRQRPISVRARSDEELAIVLRACHARHRGKYGRPRLTRDLREAGFTVNHKRVRRLMLREGLQARRPRRFVRTTDSRHRLPVAPNLLERDFRASAPNQKWVAEIVCTQMTKNGRVRCAGGWESHSGSRRRNQSRSPGRSEVRSTGVSARSWRWLTCISHTPSVAADLRPTGSAGGPNRRHTLGLGLAGEREGW
jgi:transposase InsO family protein